MGKRKEDSKPAKVLNSSFPMQFSQIPASLKRQILISFKNLLKPIHNAFKNLFIPMSQEQLQASSASPPPFDPSQPSTPISYPIKTLQELESRSYFSSFHYPFNVASVPIQSGSLPSRPRMLVCHDMAGGYLDDKWVQGGTNEGAYAIWHWYLMDVFVYFSHSLVTLPPPCWTNAAHKHGVKVLGTFITEWDEGRAICNALLSTKESAQMYAERLTELAVALGFDGWLINMEVALAKGQIPNLKEFVSHLTQTMHSSMPGSLVIWYDSVTIDSSLEWQDQLNNKNKPFFDICDGIFINYTWAESYPKISADAAGDRKFDVYMGIDVFGRNTYGGGQWNTNVALDLLKKEEVSAAIFAPGWVYETKQPPDFQTAQNRWWSLIEKSWGIQQKYPRVLPFYSNFDQGHGYHFAIDAVQVSDTPWCNISCQSFQPFLEFSEDSTNTIQVIVNSKEASYSGGGNITFKGTLQGNDYFRTRLFLGEILLGNLPVHFTYSLKSDSSSLVGLSLEFSSTLNERMSVLLAAQGSTLLTMNQFSSKFSKVIMPHRVVKIEAAPGWVIQESSIAMNGYILTEIHAVCYKSKPDFIDLKLNSGSDHLDNDLARSPSNYYAVLGHLMVKTSDQNPDFLPSSSWLVEVQHIKWASDLQGAKTLSAKIIWKLKDGNYSMSQNYNVYVEKLANEEVGNPGTMLKREQEYLGVAQVEAFYVSDFVVPSGTSSLKFIIQVCGTDGASQKLDDSPYFQLDIEEV
ncbi:cytosolic endo-beta-N-acetylglucosaminidase 1 isoform X5 [Vitis vinifera]|uniref:cytosolic endo-beta-N-acetylglucosaminidase 1 isoform X5 n=1 Tax=Vitis vinifera TaxID=29760 RepID=UPI00053FD92E|nr:cytosolic endo-beta-N-acetylglucosaminidase 1 isoform X5 [Vitis vinifera]|eukprot:XP_002273683.3 PREDICTED: cytosolic endo-beta-N-acetylglucosaminidase 1 isoform X5 [Vitis vinifera]